MILQPKNWQSFQQYKDRSPQWIKLHRDILNDFEFSRLPLGAKAVAPLLWVLASEYAEGIIDASLDEIAFRIRVTKEELSSGLDPLIKAGFFVVLPGAVKAPVRVDTVRLDTADLDECTEAYRSVQDCTEAYENVPREEKRREREETESSAVASAPRRDDEFEEFWENYPRRDGANPKEPAAKLFRAAVKSGTDSQRIIAGVKRCRVVEAGKIGTPYIPQAVKWLRDKRWNDYLAEAVTAEKATEALQALHYAKPESPQLDAWDRHYQSTQGKSAPRDRNGGWYFRTEWPPGYQPADPVMHGNVPVPQLRSMGH
jgi:hypothetical protein